jgi:SAM-dependent methyltransferase
MTVLHKLIRSIRENGVATTVSICMENVVFWVRTLSPEYRRRVKFERDFDASMGVETTDEITLGTMGEVVGDKNHAGWYAPGPIEEFREILTKEAGDVQGVTFVDLGCGKGRSLFIAAEFPFREIVGVEFSPKLCDIAQHNIAVFTRNKPGAPPIAVECNDAGQYSFPLTPLCIYMMNPFDGEIMSRVMRNLCQSLDAHPRKVTILYFNPIQNAVVDSFFKPKKHIPHPGIFSCTVYDERVAQGRSLVAEAAAKSRK